MWEGKCVHFVGWVNEISLWCDLCLDFFSGREAEWSFSISRILHLHSQHTCWDGWLSWSVHQLLTRCLTVIICFIPSTVHLWNEILAETRFYSTNKVASSWPVTEHQLLQVRHTGIKAANGASLLSKTTVTLARSSKQLKIWYYKTFFPPRIIHLTVFA